MKDESVYSSSPTSRPTNSLPPSTATALPGPMSRYTTHVITRESGCSSSCGVGHRPKRRAI